MCGIAAIFTAGNDHVAAQLTLINMLKTMKHRGPDGWGTYCAPRVLMGHVRLSILDLESGHQPMMTDRYAITFNGEIYNHVELRAELEESGERFRTKSDTEVILKAVEHYGTGAFAKLNGQFAFVLWDKLEKRVIAVRDRYGICPLYFIRYRKELYIASEMKAFDVIEGFRREYNPETLVEHGMLWNTLGDDTVYCDIKSLPPGTFELFSSPGNSRRQRYYELGETICEMPETDIDSAKEEFRHLLKDAVRLRLRSDVPVGTYLSGGIDSSIVTQVTKTLCGKALETFAVAFEDKAFDESQYQRQMAEYTGTVHHEVRCDYQSINDHMLDAAYHLERPVFRTAAVPLFLLSRAVRENNIKVVLTGEGADEILYGYDSYKELKLLEFWRRQPSSQLRPLLLKKLYPHLAHYSNPQQFGFIKMYYEGFLNKKNIQLGGLNIRVHNNRALLNFFDKAHSVAFSDERMVAKLSNMLPGNFYHWTPMQQNQFLEMKTLLPGYLLSSQADRMSMAHSVEGRYPFLDHRVVEKLFYYPDKFKLNGFLQKYLLSETYKDMIPSSIIHRAKKPYMAPDLKSFYHGKKLSEQAAHFLSPEQLKAYGIFNSRSVARFLKKFEQGAPESIGYRDNMLITFILSCQMARYWSSRPVHNALAERDRMVCIIE